MAALVLLSNRLLGLYYTAFHTYCEDHQFPSPPPPMDDVIADWQSAFNPARQEIESISCVAHGRAARQPMHINIEAQINDPKKSAIGPPNSAPRRAATGLISSSNSGPGSIAPRPNRVPSAPTTPGPRPPANSNLGIPTDFTTASGYGYEPGTSPSASSNSLQPRSDYFSGGSSSRSLRPPSAASSISTASATPSVSSVAAAAVAGKKKPPPPPPKRIGTNTKPDEFVIALYAFAGQSAGDLSFSEGDRIRVVKRTGTDQDWWVGELGGVKGSFPANYCKTT
jgi:amphiphysin